jgi:hypothetical protein
VRISFSAEERKQFEIEKVDGINTSKLQSLPDTTAWIRVRVPLAKATDIRRNNIGKAVPQSKECKLKKATSNLKRQTFQCTEVWNAIGM